MASPVGEDDPMLKLAAWIRMPGNINVEDAIDECARLLENNAGLFLTRAQQERQIAELQYEIDQLQRLLESRA